jgi:hypothetical protein
MDINDFLSHKQHHFKAAAMLFGMRNGLNLLKQQLFFKSINEKTDCF